MHLPLSGKIIMGNIRRHRKPFLIAAMLIVLACGPQVVFRTGDVIIHNDEPVLETSANSLEYGYKGSRYIKKIWPKKEPAVLTAVGDVALNFATMKGDP